MVDKDVIPEHGETSVYVPGSLERGIGSARAFRAILAGASVIVRVQVSGDGIVHDIVECGQRFLVFGDNRSFVLSISKGINVVEVPLACPVGYIVEQRERQVLWWSHTAIGALSEHGEWWVANGVAEHGVRNVKVRSRVIHYEAGATGSDEWVRRRLEIHTGVLSGETPQD